MKFKLLLIAIFVSSNLIPHIGPVGHTATLVNKTNKTIDFILNTTAKGCHGRNIFSLNPCNDAGGFNVRVKPNSTEVFRLIDQPDPCWRYDCWGCIRSHIYVNDNKILYASNDFVKAGASTFGEITGKGVGLGAAGAVAFAGGAAPVAMTGDGALVVGAGALIIFAGASVGGFAYGMAKAIELSCASITVTVSGDGDDISGYQMNVS